MDSVVNITFNQLTCLTIVTIISIIVLYYKWAFNYRAPNVPMLHPPSIPFGHLPNPLTIHCNPGIEMKDWHIKGVLAGHKILKIYNFCKPTYFPLDPQYIKCIIQNEHFVDRGFYYNEKYDPLSGNLFIIGGDQWTFVRTKLSPTFTPGKLKGMFDTLLQCGYQLEEAVAKIANKKEQINVNELSISYTINVIGSCAFGVECNCFKDPNAEFKQQGKKIFQINFFRLLKVYMCVSFPEIASKLKVRLFSEETANFFINVVKEVIQFRLKNNVKRKDMMQLLIEMRNEDFGKNDNAKKTWTQSNFEEVSAQVFIFFAAGFETSSLALTYCLFELSRNEKIQNKLRKEIRDVLKANDGNVTYDAMLEMKYMTQVIEETLRLYPPVMYLSRKCTKNYQIPGTDYHIYKDSPLVYSILGLHHDPQNFPEPEKFDPERFSAENKPKIKPFTYLPFGEGPRICIGYRFAMMQLKLAITILLRSYKLSLNKATKLPIEFKVCSVTLEPSTQIYLDIEKIS